MGSLIMFLGPMKCGKSYELLRFFRNKPRGSYKLFQPKKNVRDNMIRSRAGLELPARKIDTLADIKPGREKYIGIDELHMFKAQDHIHIQNWLKRGVIIILAGLDTDHQRRVMPIVRKLENITPKFIIYKKATCDICGSPHACFTQVLEYDLPVSDRLPPVLPEDGTYEYRPVCAKCFK